MPVLSYQVNAMGYGGVNPKIIYIFTNDSIAVVTTTGYIDWLANQQGIYTGDVALVVTRETPTSIFAANFYEFQRVGTGPHWNLVASTSTVVESVTGTLHQIVASPTTGNVIVSIAPNAQLPGTGSVGLPSGNTAQRSGISGSIRFNSQLSVFETTVDGSTWLPILTGTAGGVTSLAGTADEIDVSAATGNVTVSISNNPILPGTAAVTLPMGNTAQRGAIAGSLRFNTQLSAIELTNDGINWYEVSDSNDTVNSVSGTPNRITVTGTNNAVVDIAATYVGQTSITTVGVLTVGTWDATTIAVNHGGTSVTSFTAFAPIAAGTTPTGALKSLDDAGFASAGRVLTSNGSGAYPTWQVAPGTGAGALFWITYVPGVGILDSFGVSSASHPSTGSLTVNFSAAFTDNYCVQVSIAPLADGTAWGVNSSNANSVTVKNGFAVGHDPGIWYVCGFGTN